jgi:hypothetical protein
MSDLSMDHVIDAYAYGQLDALQTMVGPNANRKWSSEFRTVVHHLFKAQKLTDETAQILFFTRNAERMWEGMMSLESFEVINQEMDTAIVTVLRGE